MRMRDQQMRFHRLARLTQMLAEAANPGTGVEDDEITVGETHFRARSVTSVPDS